jgi:hypothetical protein
MKDAVVAVLPEYHGWSGFTQEIGRHISLGLLEVEQAEFE